MFPTLVLIMEPGTLVELLKVGGPSFIYLAGLVLALKHIAGLYEARHQDVMTHHSSEVKALTDGYDERLKVVELVAEECREDRMVLRKELSQLRERLLEETRERSYLAEEVRCDHEKRDS